MHFGAPVPARAFSFCSLVRRYSRKRIYCMDLKRVSRRPGCVADDLCKRPCVHESVILPSPGGWVTHFAACILNVMHPKENVSCPGVAAASSSVSTAAHVFYETPPWRPHNMPCSYRWNERWTRDSNGPSKIGRLYRRRSRVLHHRIDYVLRRKRLCKETMALLSLDQPSFRRDCRPAHGYSARSESLFAYRRQTGITTASALSTIQW